MRQIVFHPHFNAASVVHIKHTWAHQPLLNHKRFQKVLYWAVRPYVFSNLSTLWRSSSKSFLFSVQKYSDFLWGIAWVNLKRFYDALLVSIYRDFAMPCLCQFTDILWYPAYLILQRFYNAFLAAIYRDYTMLYNILMDRTSTEKLCKCKFPTFFRDFVKSVNYSNILLCQERKFMVIL